MSAVMCSICGDMLGSPIHVQQHYEHYHTPKENTMNTYTVHLTEMWSQRVQGQAAVVTEAGTLIIHNGEEPAAHFKSWMYYTTEASDKTSTD